MQPLVISVILLHASLCQCLFSDISFNEVNERMSKLSPVYSTVKTAKEWYSVDFVKDGKEFCSPTIARISHMPTLDADLSRPQAFISGEIHGDERIGPSAALVTAEILVQASECVIDKKEDSCTNLKSMYDIADRDTLLWLTVLATRRDTYIIPTTNCMGHLHHQRVESGVDTNRDFPYGRADGRCLRSTTAQVINSVMKNNLIQLVITFHGGMAAIGYEWGSLNHRSPQDDCPDSAVHSQIAEFMKTAAGGWTSSSKDAKPYPVGKMNSIVYPVDGGMEDWVYASGWDTHGSQNHLCDGFSYYHPGVRETKHPDIDVVFTNIKDPRVQATGNRAVVFLVETSDMKKPTTTAWGLESHLLSRVSESNGHVPRNIRLNLVGLDMLQPYLCVEAVEFGVSDVAVRRAQEQPADKCAPTATTTSSDTTAITISWSVNGVVDVDATWLSVLVNPLPSEETVNKYVKQNSYSKLLHYLNGEHGTKGAPQKGVSAASMSAEETYEVPLAYTLHTGDKGRWADGSADFAQPKQYSHKVQIKPLVTRTADCTFPAAGASETDVVYLPLGVHWIVPFAAVDGAMGRAAQGYPRTADGVKEGEEAQPMPPQSHMSNARTNPAWHSVLATGDVDSAGMVHAQREREVVGFRHWAAEPIIVRVYDKPGGGLGVEKLSATLHCAWWDAASSDKAAKSSSKILWAEPSVEELSLVDGDAAVVVGTPPAETTPAAPAEANAAKPKSDSSSFSFMLVYGVAILSLIGIIRFLISRFLGGRTRQFYGSSNSSFIKEMKPNLGIYKSGNTRPSHQYEMVSTRDADR